MTEEERPGWWARNRGRLLAVLLAAVLLPSPWWGRAVARRLAFFRVRHVELVGVRYAAPGEIVRLLQVDTLASVWDDTDAWERRVAAHPQVRTVEISRKLPGTLVVRVDENMPVALVPGPRGFRVFDAGGRELPIDPSRVPVDLPIVPRRDTAALRLLAEVRQARPRMFARISEVRRTGKGELLLQLASLPVRVGDDLLMERLDEIAPVEEHLAKRGARIAEIDLRFRDQVIARVQ